MMTIFDFKENIKQYNAIKNGIDDLNERIDKMEKREKIVKDSVKASGKSFPYTQHNVVVEGYQDDHGRLMRRKKVLAAKKEELEQLKEEMEQFINTNIKDERIRQILQYKYVDELSYVQIEHKIGGSAEAIRKELERFLKKK